MWLIRTTNILLMKVIDIRFFSPQDNQAANPKKEKSTTPKKVILTGYISAAGKLVFPAKTMAELGVDVEQTAFKVGIAAGKRKAKSLYLIEVDRSLEESFPLEKGAKSYTMSLAAILTKSGVNYATSKYSFLIELFDYEGSTALELQLRQDEVTPKVPYTGKPRGRKSKSKAMEE